MSEQPGRKWLDLKRSWTCVYLGWALLEIQLVVDRTLGEGVGYTGEAGGTWRRLEKWWAWGWDPESVLSTLEGGEGKEG